MTTIAEAIEEIGLQVEQPDGDLVLVTFHQGKPKHRTATEVANRPITGEVYLAGAVFKPGTVNGHGGRVAENIERIWCLQCDADLIDWLGGEWSKEMLYALPQDHLWELIELQEQDLREAFAALDLRPQRIDYTGYGLCAYFYIENASQGQIERLRAIHKRLVERVNQTSGVERFLDPQVTDSGTRITRLPGSANLKGSIRRTVEMRERVDGAYSVEELEARLGERLPPVRLVPETGKGLDAATADLIVNHMAAHWTEGRRHALALGLAGMLAKAGVPESQTRSIIGRLSADDGESDDRFTAVTTTYSRLKSGRETRGFYGLREQLPPDFVHWLDGELEKIRPVVAGVRLKTHGVVEDNNILPVVAPLPELAVHGLCRTYVDLVIDSTESCEAFHLGSLLGVVSAMVGRRVSCQYAGDRLYGSLFIALVGKSGTSRKDTAIRRALALRDVRSMDGGGFITPSFFVARDVSSGEGLIDTLKDHPTTLLYLSEMSVMMKNAQRKGTTTILDRLIEVWDVPHVLENRSKLAKGIAENPFMSIVAATQPARLERQMTAEDIASGFANRWLFLPGDGERPLADPDPVDEHELEALFFTLHRRIDSYPVGFTMPTTDAGKAWWTPWYEAFYWDQKKLDEDQATMKVRMPTMIRKLALLFAIMDGERAVDVRHLVAGAALVEWSWVHVREMLKLWGVGTLTQIERKIEDVLTLKGAMTKRQLARLCSNRKWSGREFNQVLVSMRDNGIVAIGPDGVVGLVEDE